MAKYNGGAVMVGKIGSIVYRVRNGETIASQYQPNVANPSTENQVKVRAKLKLLSQLSASVGDVIAIPRNGLKSPRNLFTKVNYKFTDYQDNEASIQLANVQLTDSAVGLAGFHATRTEGVGISVEMDEAVNGAFDRIVYVGLQRTTSGAYVPFASAVCQTAGENGTFPCVLPYVAGDISLHAYGIKDKSAAATAAFDNLHAAQASDVAKIIANRSVKMTDVTLSETRGLFLAGSAASGNTPGLNYVNISVRVKDADWNDATAYANITGVGQKQVGESVTLTASVNTGATFLGWKDEQSGEYLSQSATYTFVAPSTDRRVYAVVQLTPGGGSGGEGGMDQN